ncbi:MAG: TIGR04211 family SH3 domain-containing protein [Gammaproteobacteria bacterium HGW-Gammaproteobacteria-3]|nr:MAG: TIGR04211 family SH3 domain-containing protein [Gammaproteobacteria bacterium HGW-Gammaproteobacteria-3]
MKTILSLLITLFIALNTAHAKTVYVTDDLELTLRSMENNRSKILKMLRSGTALTLLEEKPSGYSQVRTSNGIEGYFLTRHLKSEPPLRWHLEQANKKIEALQKDNESLKAELSSFRGDNTENIESTHELTQERDRLRSELAELKLTAANAVELKNQRDRFQERIVTVERELQKISRENQTLQDSATQDWFLYGGILSLLGVLLGVVLPKLGWRRKTSNWNTF